MLPPNDDSVSREQRQSVEILCETLLLAKKLTKNAKENI